MFYRGKLMLQSALKKNAQNSGREGILYIVFYWVLRRPAVVSLSYEQWCCRLLTRVDIDQDHSHQGPQGPKARDPSQVLVNVCLIPNCTKLLYTDKIWRVGCYQVSGSMFGYRKVTAKNVNNYVLGLSVADLWRHCIRVLNISNSIKQTIT